MLLVKASVRPSRRHGLGLFADEFIPKGTVTWTYDPRFDLRFDEAEVRSMPPIQQDLIDRHAFVSKVSGKYVFSIDDTRFTNHSAKHNNIDVQSKPGDDEVHGVANRDIQSGEELMSDYRAFDAVDATSSEEYLNS